MHSYQLEQLARLRTDELRCAAERRARAGRGRADRGRSRRDPGCTMRKRAGWALVAIGLRLAESG